MRLTIPHRLPRLKYTLTTLDPARAMLALPLARLGRPGISELDWKAFVDAMAGGPDADTGIMVVEDAHGYLYGLFSFAVERRISPPRVLAVDNFVAIDLIGAQAVARQMLAGIRELARRHGCDAISVAMPTPTGSRVESGTAALFRDFGLRMDAVRMAGRLTVPSVSTHP